MCILPFLAMCLMVLEGYVYTIAAYIYAFRLAFSSILHGILHHITLYFAENSPKTGAIGGCLK